MGQDTVATNYNVAGTEVLERIYAEDYLSPGGATSTQSLAAFGQIASGKSVLDVGSGLGGAAFYLAEVLGCTVQGVDLMHWNVVSAAARSRAKGLSGSVNFVCGDATLLPFQNGCFDVIWGQDAWCHVNSKEALVAEFARVLKPNGKLVFSDWLLKESPNPENDAIRRVTASPNMTDTKTYQRLLQNKGFELLRHQDNSRSFTLCYQDVLKQLQALEQELCDRYSRKLYEIVLSKQKAVLKAFESGVLESGSFVAIYRH